MKTKLFAPFLAILIFSTFFTVGAQTPPCLQLKATTLPAPGDYGGAGQFTVTRQTIQHTDPDVPAPISVFLPSNANPANRVPIVFFSHGNNSHNYLFFEGLLNQLASNGYIVVFAPSLSNPTITHPARYGQFWSGFQLAIQQYGNLMDTTRVGFAGHSIGGGAVPELARRGAAEGWGSNGFFLMPMAAWYSWGTDYTTIPATAKLVVQVYWDDVTNEHLISQNDIWNRLPQITERRWQVIRTARTTCELTAGHLLPMAPPTPAARVDGLDYWGVWRRLHALSDYTFTGNLAARPVAFGEDTYMGRWRLYAMRPIIPLEATDFPVLNTTINTQIRWLDRCIYARGFACVPPSGN